jgi:periplasmic divalent cation tolerance protein
MALRRADGPSFRLAELDQLMRLGSMQIAWTTVGKRTDAEILAREAVRQNLAACVQIDGPITSVYRWEGRVEQAEEFRLQFKFLPEQRAALSALVHSRHPYATPEWIVLEATEVGEKYLSWARALPTNPPL